MVLILSAQERPSMRSSFTAVVPFAAVLFAANVTVLHAEMLNKAVNANKLGLYVVMDVFFLRALGVDIVLYKDSAFNRFTSLQFICYRTTYIGTIQMLSFGPLSDRAMEFAGRHVSLFTVNVLSRNPVATAGWKSLPL